MRAFMFWVARLFAFSWPAATASRDTPAAFAARRRPLMKQKAYEITFWAKNDTNKRQTDIYKKAIEDFPGPVSQHHRKPAAVYRLWKDLQRRDHQHLHRDHTQRLHHLSRPHRHLSHRRSTWWSPWTLLSEDSRNSGWEAAKSPLKFDGPGKEDLIPEFLKECYRKRAPTYAMPLHAIHRGLLYQSRPMWKSWATPCRRPSPGTFYLGGIRGGCQKG